VTRDRRDSDPCAPSGSASGPPGPVERNEAHACADSAAPTEESEGGGPITLGDTAAIYVTERATREYAAGMGHAGPLTRDELERYARALLALADDGRAVDVEASPERWRSRRRAHGRDVSLQVVRERPIAQLEPIAIVASCSVRAHRAGRSSRK
jgi:hypothetical protein